jgi:hypothetical protein
LKRIVVLGGFGFFGAAAVERLRADGLKPLIGSRRSAADLNVDIEDVPSLRTQLRPEDIVVDTVGPFQQRTTALLESALDVGFDVVDISDSFAYAEKVSGLRARIDAAGIRVLSSCSSISSITAAVVQRSEIASPIRVTGLLAPASKYAAYPATQASLLSSVGKPVRVFRDGRLVMRHGWGESRLIEFPSPGGSARGYLFESADSFWLPKIWPSLQTVDFYMDSSVFGLNTVLLAASKSSAVRWMVNRSRRSGLALTRWLGRPKGYLAYEVQGKDGTVFRFAFVAAQRGYVVPVVPAAIAAHDIATGEFGPRGLVFPHLHVHPGRLTSYLEKIGVQILTASSHFAGRDERQGLS